MRAAFFLVLGCASCVQVAWGREARYEPVPDEAIGRLQAYSTELGECLAAFGAPLWVWEYPEHGHDGAVLAYGWFDARSLGLTVSVPISDQASASFDYDQLDRRMRGLVLFFDQDWRLTDWRVGLLFDLTQDLRRRPVPLDDEPVPEGA